MTSTLQPYWTSHDGTAHELCKLLFFLGKTYCGASPIDPGDCPQLGWRRGGVAYFCGDCGDLWARIVLLNSRGEIQAMEVVQVACERHPDQWEVAGSLLSGARNFGYLDYLPAELVKREYEIVSKIYP